MIEPKNALIGLLIVGAFFLLIQSQTTEVVTNNRGCEGVWIEYDGHCCIDNNYNNVCDLLEDKKIFNGKYFGKCKDNSDCEGGEYSVIRMSGSKNVCKQDCISGRCVVSDCFIPVCVTDDDCRKDFNCENYRCE